MGNLRLARLLTLWASRMPPATSTTRTVSAGSPSSSSISASTAPCQLVLRIRWSGKKYSQVLADVRSIFSENVIRNFFTPANPVAPESGSIAARWGGVTSIGPPGGGSTTAQAARTTAQSSRARPKPGPLPRNIR